MFDLLLQNLAIVQATQGHTPFESMELTARSVSTHLRDGLVNHQSAVAGPTRGAYQRRSQQG